MRTKKKLTIIYGSMIIMITTFILESRDGLCAQP